MSYCLHVYNIDTTNKVKFSLANYYDFFFLGYLIMPFLNVVQVIIILF